MNATLGACCSVLLTAALTASCTPQEKTLSPPRIRPVRYQEVAQVAATRIRTFSGAAKAAMESKISFKVAGTISTLDAEVGDRVREGQLIAELDDRDYHLRVKEAEAALGQAGAQLRNARANFARTRALYENDNASRNDYDTARTAVETSEAGRRGIPETTGAKRAAAHLYPFGSTSRRGDRPGGSRGQREREQRPAHRHLEFDQPAGG